MNNIKFHTHKFVSEVKTVLNNLNMYLSTKFIVSLTSERANDKTIATFEIVEEGQFREGHVNELRLIYRKQFFMANIYIDNSIENALEIDLDKFIEYSVKDDFIMSAITNFSKAADEQRSIGNTMWIVDSEELKKKYNKNG